MDIITDPEATISERLQAIESNAHLDMTLLKLEYEGTIYFMKIAGSNAKSNGTPDSKFIKRQADIIAGIPAATSTPRIKDAQLTEFEHRQPAGQQQE